MIIDSKTCVSEVKQATLKTFNMMTQSSLIQDTFEHIDETVKKWNVPECMKTYMKMSPEEKDNEKTTQKVKSI